MTCVTCDSPAAFCVLELYFMSVCYLVHLCTELSYGPFSCLVMSLVPTKIQAKTFVFGRTSQIINEIQ